ncbi:unnamed protein product [Nippostrongylus brasiliensis]|uniref:HECT domain-containing protein n=1 Tax=Nippostrongylus brasiliensis TaxID=27835 RepID=A0A0N4XS64_NIPBR|nr:unnamed protein product [Nippostrongylus brasiliensis]
MSDSTEEVEVRVLFFGKARELMECEETTTRLPTVLPYSKLKHIIFSEMGGSDAQLCMLYRTFLRPLRFDDDGHGRKSYI